jgi:hypothetical protein
MTFYEFLKAAYDMRAPVKDWRGRGRVPYTHQNHFFLECGPSDVWEASPEGNVWYQNTLWVLKNAPLGAGYTFYSALGDYTLPAKEGSPTYER